MNHKKINCKELFKGILIIVSYLLGGRVLSLIFSFFIKKLNITSYAKIFNLIIYLVLAIIYVIIFNKDLKKDFKDFKNNYKKYLKTGISYYLKGIFIMYVSNYILLFVFKLSKSVNEMQNIEMIKNNMLFHIIIIILLAPLLEEIVFRISFKNITKDITTYSIITGVIFGTAHVISSLEDPKMILLAIPYSAMGIALGFIYKKTNNIYTSLTIHMIHNTITAAIIIIGILGGIV